MKKLFVSAGLVAVGATGLHGAYAPGLTRMQSSRPWSVSASLRGFYDDNYLTAPSGSSAKRDSFGFEVSPSFALNFPMERTYIGLQYIYSLKYYEDRKTDTTDQSHEFIAKLDHRFSERYKLELADSFVYSQEPEVLESSGSGTITNPLRTESDVLRNRANIDFTAQLTELLGIALGYQNTWYDYSQDASDVRDPVFNPSGVGSRSALLDRMEHLFHIDGRWEVRKNLIGILGYQYGIVDYTSDDPIVEDATTVPSTLIPGDIRDNTSHYFYVGAEYALTSQFSGSGRVGVRYTDHDDLSESAVSPYLDLRGTYTYLPGSYVQFGFRHDRNATDVSGEVDNITRDQESSTAYASVTHRITPRITGNAIGQLQHSVFNGGDSDGEADNFYILGFNLEYSLNRNWTAEAGYNFDRLDSDLGNRSFSRNRVYVGVRATY